MRAKVLTVALTAMFVLTACGSDQDGLVGTWKEEDDEGVLTIEEQDGALHIGSPESSAGSTCDGLIDGEQSPYDFTIVCSDSAGNEEETTGTLKVIDENKINLVYKEEVYFEYKTVDHILERVEN